MPLRLLILFALLLSSALSISQKVTTIHHRQGLDSSYYHILKVHDNEFWLGGKHGILNKIDSLGNLQKIPYPNHGLRILKMIKTADYIFLSTDNAVIYRYDLATEAFEFKKFSDFDNRAFYDMIATPEGKILLVGGSTAIVESKKKFPRGFIAIMDQDMNDIEVVWNSFRKFVWSVTKSPSGELVAASFNGLNTKLISSTDAGRTWSKTHKIKGLVHEVTYNQDALWYCGARSFYFFDYFWKNGILGEVGRKKYKLEDKACQWSMDFIADQLITVSTKGKVVFTDRKTGSVESIRLPRARALYDILMQSLCFYKH